MLKKYLLFIIASLVMLPALADKPNDKGNKGGSGVFLSVVFRDYFNDTEVSSVPFDNFGSDNGNPYINGKESVGAHIDKWRFGLNVGLNGERNFFLDLSDCRSYPDCVSPSPYFKGWNVFATSPDGAQYLNMSANGDDPDHSKLVNFQVEFFDDGGNYWLIKFDASECPGVSSDDMVTVTKISDDAWEFEATADKLACLYFREGPRKNHYFAGLYSVPFRLTAVAVP